MYTYEFKITYFKFLDSIFEDSFDYFFNSLFCVSLLVSPFQLVHAFLLDSCTKSILIQIFCNHSWYKSVLASQDTSLILIHHPEMAIIKTRLSSLCYFELLSDFNFTLLELVGHEAYITPVMLAPQLVVIIYASALFICFYFSFYSSSVKDESTIDSDYLAATSTVEAEKELGSLDDMMLGVLVLAYIFG